MEKDEELNKERHMRRTAIRHHRNRNVCIMYHGTTRYNVKKINYQGHPLPKFWHINGYDTAWVPPNCRMVPSGLVENCVYDPR
uniref:PARP catalytic domain-containing protein n=1 Tax=Electrophorus electricus TaxID=8005 RepID=A0AAY5EB83_ELEEL